MATRKSQNAISTEDMHTYINFLLTNDVQSEEHAKEINRISKLIVTLTDVTLLVKVMQQKQDNVMGQMMEAIQVQSRVLEKLGATEEMFSEAEHEYNEAVAAKRKEFEDAQKAAMEAAKEEA